MKYLHHLIISFLAILITLISAEEAPINDTGFLPATLDREAAAYTINEKSLSPDGRYGVAYPKKSGDDLSLAKNFLVSVKPFQLLTILEGDGLSAESKSRSLVVKWTADSSQVIVTTLHSKWDMIVGSSLAVLSKGKVALRVNLLSAVNGHLLADFQQSKAEAYNEFLPFILTETQLDFVENGKYVHIVAEALNDPNSAREIQWTASFDGLWDVAGASWNDSEMADVTSELIGSLKLGQKSDEVIKFMGQPESKNKDTLMSATGEWQQDWNYPAKGLTLSMGSGEENGAKTISTIRAGANFKLATARGIKIGSSEADVKNAYAKEHDKEMSRAGELFIAGSIYGGVMFDLQKGKVIQIYIGQGAE